MTALFAMVVLLCTADDAVAQRRVPETERLSAGISAGLGTMTREGTARSDGGLAFTVDARLAPGWLVQVQGGAGPARHATVGLARAVASTRPRTYLSLEGGLGRFDADPWGNGVYGGAGFQVAVRDSPLAVTGGVRLFLLSQSIGFRASIGLEVQVR